MPGQQEKDTTEVYAVKKFRKHFDRTSKPAKKAELPESIGDLNIKKLSDLMLLYTAWREYTEDLLTDALADFTIKKEVYGYEYDKFILLQPKATKQINEAKATTDPKLRRLYLDLQDAELYHTMLVKRELMYANCYATISREISLRGLRV